MPKKLKLNGSMQTYKTFERGLEHITRKSTDTWKPGVTDKFGLGVQNEAGERLKSSAKRTH